MCKAILLGLSFIASGAYADWQYAVCKNDSAHISKTFRCCYDRLGFSHSWALVSRCSELGSAVVEGDRHCSASTGVDGLNTLEQYCATKYNGYVKYHN